MFVGCLTSQQHASVSQGRICSDNFTCCHAEMEVADLTFHLTQSQYTDTGQTSPSTDPITPGAWQGSHWSDNLCHWYDSAPEKSRRKRDSEEEEEEEEEGGGGGGGGGERRERGGGGEERRSRNQRNRSVHQGVLYSFKQRVKQGATPGPRKNQWVAKVLSTNSCHY